MKTLHDSEDNLKNFGEKVTKLLKFKKIVSNIKEWLKVLIIRNRKTEYEFIN